MSNVYSPRIARAACLASLGLALLVPGIAHADEILTETRLDIETTSSMTPLVAQDEIPCADEPDTSSPDLIGDACDESNEAITVDGNQPRPVEEAPSDELSSTGDSSANEEETISSEAVPSEATRVEPSDALGESFDETTSSNDGEEAAALEDNEAEAMPSDGWSKENGGWSYYRDGEKVSNGWVVSDAFPEADARGLQRYWLGADGFLVRNHLIDTLDGYWAYARPEGYVVRGRYVAGDVIYFADNDGRLLSPGWNVTGEFTGGALERYYIDPDLHGAVVGWSDDGTRYTKEDGTTLRGGTVTADGMVWADNDGNVRQSGWLVTDGFGQGMQRYWIESGKVATSELIKVADDLWAYARPEGCVVRGKYTDPNTGYVYLANNDGVLESPGWAVTDEYGDGLQRYYINATSHACQPGYSEDDWDHYVTQAGYVLRGKLTEGDTVLISNNDGLLEQAAGWVVTGVYDGGNLQRYWLERQEDGSLRAKTGFFVIDGLQFYGMPDQGYVLRGGRVLGADRVFADNEGVIKTEGWLVTDSFGDGLQRYWFSDSKVVTGLISEDECGWWAFGTQRGYVVRGRWEDPETGLVYLADNDGRLENPGWLVTGVYDGGKLQRYYIDEKSHACRAGLFSVGSESYLGLGRVGYVLRGTHVEGATTWHADNDGILIPSFAASVGKDEKARVVATFVGDTPYLFLPAHANLSDVVLSFGGNFGSSSLLFSVNGVDFERVESGSSFDLTDLVLRDGVRVISFKTSPESRVRTLAIMVSANVRAMYLVSEDPVNEGRPFIDGSPDHSTKAKGYMLLVNPDGSVVYNGELSQIKGRGNTTWGASSKKPYQIKLDKKTDLLETGDKDNKAKTWVLLANANDASLLHNTVAYQLAQKLGLDYTPECAPIDLYYDGEYRGSYLLSEKVEINGGRVDIHKLEDDIEEANPDVDLDELPTAQAVNKYGQTFQYVVGVKNPADISGGYLTEFDTAYYKSERCWFMTSAGAFVVKEPGNLSYAQMLYISELMQEAIDAAGNGGINPITGKSLDDYADIESLSKLYLLNEFAKNVDFTASSAYYYLPGSADVENGAEQVFYGGPVWDFDASFGIRNESPEHFKPEGFAIENWFTSSSQVRELVKMEFSSTLIPLIEELVSPSGGLDSLVNKIGASQAMNEVLWGLTSFPNCSDPYPTYRENVEYFRGWLTARLGWISANGLSV